MSEPVIEPIKVKATPKAKTAPKVKATPERVPGYNHDTGEFISRTSGSRPHPELAAPHT